MTAPAPAAPRPKMTPEEKAARIAAAQAAFDAKKAAQAAAAAEAAPANEAAGTEKESSS